MKKLLLLFFTLITIQTFSQRIDTVPCMLLVRVSGITQIVRGYAIFQKQDSECKVLDFLTFRKKKFPNRIRVQDYSIISK